jgi:hypothetical protein
MLSTLHRLSMLMVRGDDCGEQFHTSFILPGTSTRYYIVVPYSSYSNTRVLHFCTTRKNKLWDRKYWLNYTYVYS